MDAKGSWRRLAARDTLLAEEEPPEMLLHLPSRFLAMIFFLQSTTERDRRYTTCSQWRNSYQIETGGMNSYGLINIKNMRRKPKSKQFPEEEHHWKRPPVHNLFTRNSYQIETGGMNSYGLLVIAWIFGKPNVRKLAVRIDRADPDPNPKKAMTSNK